MCEHVGVSVTVQLNRISLEGRVFEKQKQQCVSMNVNLSTGCDHSCLYFISNLRTVYEHQWWCEQLCVRVKEGYTQWSETHNWEIWNVGVCGEGSFCLADLHRQLASHVSPQLISNQHRTAHAHSHRHTHILYPSLRRLCSLMPLLHSLFRSLLPSLFVPLGICVWFRYERWIC